MRRIVRLDMASMLKLFGLFYALVGLYIMSKAVLGGDDSLQFPFGFAYPLCSWYLYLTVHVPHSGAWPPWASSSSVLCSIRSRA